MGVWGRIGILPQVKAEAAGLAGARRTTAGGNMPIGMIDPSALRMQSNEVKKSALPGVGVTDFTAALGATGATAAAVKGGSNGYQTAAVISAATTGLTGAPGSFGGASNAPYYGGLSTASTPFASGGYGYGSVPTAGGYVGAGIPGVGGVGAGIGAPSQDYQEKQALFQQMNDANWEMLLAQVTVNEISRDYQARSNILKTKSDTELNAVRNMRA